MSVPPTEAAHILVVDDERVIREILAEFLVLEGYQVHTVEDGAKALTELRIRPYDLVLTDMKMPNVSGLELLESIVAEKLGPQVVMMTGFGTVESAIEAMKKGAHDYLLKPFKVEEVIAVASRALDRQRLQAENIRLREALTIYRVSEAIVSAPTLEMILDTILDAVMVETSADVASLHLRDVKTGEFSERIKRNADNASTRVAPTPHFGVLAKQFIVGNGVVAHGPNAGRFFTENHSHGELHSYIAVPMQVGGTMAGVVNLYSYTVGKKFDEGHRKMLSVLASRAASAIDNARLYEDLRQSNQELRQANMSLEDMFAQTVAGFAQALEESDMYTRGHSERVAVYSEILARGLTLGETEVRNIVQAGVMHDVGKIGVRYDMLNKPGKLTPEEVAVFRQHPEKGRRILEPVPCLHGLIDGCYCHHEWFDGGGYPRGLAGDDIPLVGRLVAIADAYDAMTSDRAYRRALRHEVAIGEIERCAGTQFDPRLAVVFVRLLDEWRERMRAAGQDSLVPL
jgi:response regulator RpfG family c-di-GMP phosphodiesterase